MIGQVKDQIKDQIKRCEIWLQEEPDDQEVINKVKELKEELEKIESNESALKEEEIRKESYYRIKRLRKEINKMKKELREEVPILNGMEEECMALREIDNDIKEVNVKIINDKIEEYNKLVDDYMSKYK